MSSISVTMHRTQTTENITILTDYTKTIIIKQYFQMDISNDSKKKLLNKIMSLNDPVIIDILSSHISKCFHVRDKSP